MMDAAPVGEPHSCGYVNRRASEFCGNCGVSIAPPTCGACGIENPRENVYCDACGHALRARQGGDTGYIASPVSPYAPYPPTAPPPKATRGPAPAIAAALRSAKARSTGFAAAHWDVLVLGGITLAGLGLRLVSLNSVPPNLSPDEADNLLFVYRIMAGNAPGFFGIDWSQSPAFSLYLVSWIMGVFGEGIVGGRMPSVLLSTLTLPVFYVVARRFELNRPAALGATLLLATGLWHLQFSRNGWYNIHVALYALMAMGALLAGVGRKSLPLFAAAGACAALGLYAYPAGRMIIVSIAAYAPFALALEKANRRRLLFGFAVLFTTTFILYLPHLNFALDNWDAYNTRARAVYVFNEENRAAFGDANAARILAEQTLRNVGAFIFFDASASHVGFNARYIAPDHGFLDRFTGILFWIGLVSAAFQWRRALPLWAFFLVMVFPIQILTNGSPDGARAVGAIPLFYLFVAMGLHGIFESRRVLNIREWLMNRYAQAAVAAAMLCIACLNVADYFAWMGQPSAAAARQPAVERDNFDEWRSLQKSEVESGRNGFNVFQWRELKGQD